MMTTPTNTNTLINQPPPATHFAKTFVALLGLGLLGVLTLIPFIFDQVDVLPPELTELPTPVLIAVLLLNPLILLAIAVAVGTLLAHRVGLRSLVAERVRSGTVIWPNLRPHIPMAFVTGLVLMLIITGLDQLMDPFANAELIGELPTADNPLMQLVMGVLYGGITEELLLRWGFMSLLVWMGWRVFQRGTGVPHAALVWTAIIVAAIAFGVGHLPAMASIVVLTPLIIVRTILLNALAGIYFGWLFWRYNLETAMVSHASFHVGMFVISLGVLLLGNGS
ncbi:CPBP family intramembrane glutamic endopeptidase [Candidatus Viridilinea mediisalina]|uniref:CAAX prenyl protease 2/Lysostaphin resistance protein A-like domain-containing protein n=1 Tax=Candidatus Viridilinea mediisalina TaxID=2024553 RepID=A0A2A6RM80_9CHLR|nr:CPBP family intramembrane glutamic endopeptidase [Candidatus Viridilinea mediisalina]PDW03988.1 hypothetical protein CJ255_05860 [Candidatus Viridilinea mediisalina]